MSGLNARLFLRFCPLNVSFVGESVTEDADMEEKFELICSELLEKGVGEHKNFGTLCAKMKTDGTSMNNLFYEKFGVSGDEVFCKFLVDSIAIAV